MLEVVLFNHGNSLIDELDVSPDFYNLFVDAWFIWHGKVFLVRKT
jgi:hypothetical protein